MTEIPNPTHPPELTDEDYELLSAYIDNMLSDAERTLLEARLENDALLRAELRALRQTVNLIQSLPDLQAPRNFTLTAEMVAREEAEQPVSPPKVIPFYRRNWLPLASAAAALVVVVLGGLLILTQGGNLAGGAAPEAANQVAAAPTMTSTSINAEQDSLAEAAEAAESALALRSFENTEVPATDRFATTETAGDAIFSVEGTPLPPQNPAAASGAAYSADEADFEAEAANAPQVELETFAADDSTMGDEMFSLEPEAEEASADQAEDQAAMTGGIATFATNIGTGDFRQQLANLIQILFEIARSLQAGD